MLSGGLKFQKVLLAGSGPQNMAKQSLAGRGFGRVFRLGVMRGLRSVEVNPDDFRKQLATKHGVWVPNFSRMHDVPLERLDAIAKKLIRDAERLALAEGAGFGLGGMMTVIPDTGLLTAITLRLIQRLCLLYGFEPRGVDDRMEQMFEKLAPKIAGRLASKLGAEAAEKWVGRMIPLASSAIGGALNFSFVRTWGWRVQKNLRERHIASRAASARPAYTPTGTPRPVLV
jgi:uncharacterized protein (DUF697 family)